MLLYSALRRRAQMWQVTWLQGAIEWWLTGLAQMKHTSASSSAASFCVSSLTLKFCILAGCADLGASFSAGFAGALGVPECCAPPLPLPLPRPLPPRPLLLPLWPSPRGAEGA